MPSDSYLHTTERTGLRAWRDDDFEPFVELNADPQVMRHFPAPQSREQSRAFFDRLRASFAERGFTYFALDRLDTGEWIGFVGLLRQDFEASFTPCIDIGWRLRPGAWGHGFAAEAARACLALAFKRFRLDAVHAIAPLANTPSLRVMQRIGLRWVEDFDHPRLLADERLRRCAHYRCDAPTDDLGRTLS